MTWFHTAGRGKPSPVHLTGSLVLMGGDKQLITLDCPAKYVIL